MLKKMILMVLLTITSQAQVLYKDLAANNVVATGAVVTASTWNTVTANGSNNFVVSPAGSGNIKQVWQGSYSNFLSLVKDTNTLYVLTDEPVYKTESIYQVFDSYNTITSPDTTSVHVVQDQTIYMLTVTNNSTLFFDLSSLDFSNKVATFEVWLAQLNTNAIIEFAQSVYWVSGTPTLNTLSTNYFTFRAFGINTIHANLQYKK